MPTKPVLSMASPFLMGEHMSNINDEMAFEANGGLMGKQKRRSRPRSHKEAQAQAAKRCKQLHRQKKRGRPRPDKVREAESPLQECAIVAEVLAVGQEINQIESKYREALYLEMSKLVAVAHRLRDDEDAWAEFCRSEAWNKFAPRLRPKLESQSTGALQSVLLLAFGPEDDVRDRRSKWLTALQPLFDQHVKPSDLVDYIRRNGGRDGLCKINRQKAKVAASAASAGNLMVEVPAGEITEKITQMPVGKWIRLSVKLRKREGGVMEVQPLNAVEHIHRTSNNRRKLKRP